MVLIWKTQEDAIVSHENDVVSKLLVTMEEVEQILLERNILDSPSVDLQECIQQEWESPNVIPVLKVDKCDCWS